MKGRALAAKQNVRRDYDLVVGRADAGIDNA